MIKLLIAIPLAVFRLLWAAVVTSWAKSVVAGFYGAVFLWMAMFMLAVVAGAQPVINATPRVDAISHSTARITWHTDVVSSVRIKYGLTAGLGSVSEADHSWMTTANPQFVLHSWFLTGLAPSTTYHYQACSSNGGGEDCDPATPATFQTTALPAVHPAEPTLPTPWDTAVPTQGGTTRTVGADCESGTDGLLALWVASSYGDTIEIPPTTTCTGQYTFAAKSWTSGWIVIKSAAAASLLPPEGTRAGPAHAGAMARIVHNAPRLPTTTLASLTSANCYAGKYFWVTDDARAFKLQQCRPQTAQTITGVANTSPIRITVASHGYSTNDTVRITSVGGTTNANGTYKASVVDSNNFDLLYIDVGGNVAGNGAWTSGGSVVRNVWTEVPFTTGAALPGTCTVGDWFLKTGGAAQDNSYWCLATNTWTRINLNGRVNFSDGAALDFTSNGITHVRLIGLEITTIQPPVDALVQQRLPRFQPASHRTLYTFMSLLSFDGDYTVVDRCWVHDRSDNLTAPSFVWYAINHGAGSYHAVLDSTLTVSFWTGGEPDSGPIEIETSVIAINSILGSSAASNPYKIRNNYIECVGICVFGQEPVASNRHVSDVEIVGNDFIWPEAHKYGSASSNGKMYCGRHLLEFKAGERILIEGNNFEGTFASLNNAAAIALTTRPGTFGVHTSGTVTSGTFTCTYGASLKDPCTWPSVGEWVEVVCTAPSAYSTLHQVATNGATLTFTGGNPADCTAGNFDRPQGKFPINDVTIRYNRFARSTNGVFAIGHTDAAKYNSYTASRWLFEGNIFDQLDGTRANGYGVGTTWGHTFPNGNGGYPFYVSLGFEDLIWRHNTIYAQNPYGGMQLEGADVTRGTPAEGLRYVDNIVWYTTGIGGAAISEGNNSFSGTPALDRHWKSGTDGSYTYTKNVIAKSGALPTTSPLGPYPTGNKLHDLSGGAFPFADAATGDFRVTASYRSGDNCHGVAGDCTTDGRDAGANMQAFNSARGIVTAPTIKAGSTSVQVRYLAADTGVCSFDYSSNSWTSATRTADSGGGRFRELTITGLTASTSYSYRLNCRTFLSGSFATTATGSAITVTVGGRTPSWATDTILDYGTTPSLGTSTTAEACAPCAWSVSHTSSAPLYYRLRHRNAATTVIATGSIQSIIP